MKKIILYTFGYAFFILMLPVTLLGFVFNCVAPYFQFGRFSGDELKKVIDKRLVKGTK